MIRKVGPQLQVQNHMVSSNPCPEIVRPALGLFLCITNGGASHLRDLNNKREAGNVPFRFFFGKER